MGGPTQKFFGSLSLDSIGKAVKEIPSKFTVHEKYGKQLKIQAAQWDDDGISLSIYNSETKESIKIGSLKVSQFDDTPKQPNSSNAISW